MPNQRSVRRLSYVLLFASLLLITVMFGVRATYSPAVYFALALIQFTGASLAAWKLGVSGVRSDSEDNRVLAAAGALLIMPWILFSFLAGLSAPPLATPSENQLRYVILLMNSMAVAGGLLALRQSLSAAGEHFYSTLGVAAGLLAFPLYAIFASISLIEHRAIERVAAVHADSGFVMIDELSVVALLFGAALTYMATAAYAVSLGRIQWIGRSASRVFVGVSLVAVLCVGIKLVAVLQTPHGPMWNFAPWYAVPGNVLSIPAVPWIMLVLLGIVLVRRAGDGQT